jgi:hypothetical protein
METMQVTPEGVIEVLNRFHGGVAAAAGGPGATTTTSARSARE